MCVCNCHVSVYKQQFPLKRDLGNKGPWVLVIRDLGNKGSW